VSPLLPEGSYCSSGYRSAAEQRAILHKFYRDKFSAEIIAKYSRETYDEVAKDLEANEERVLDMVRGVGQAIAAPGASMHQKSKAVDIGGPPNIDDKQVQVVKLVAHAHPDVFSGFVLKERNGCVHFEIR
jgi:LAS superfamily LD-carboxypeptidase LdcB